MSDANRTRLCWVRETTLGVTPNTPRMRTARMTGEGLKYEPKFVDSDELDVTRMNDDPEKVNETNDGPVNIEMSFPVDDSPLSDWLRSLLWNVWVNTPVRDNDGTADSVITGVAATGGIITVTTGAAFVVGHLLRLSGFGQAGNNGLFRVTTGSATVPAVGNSLLTDEAAPAAAARVKAVGFQGASGDVTALSDGLGATSLDLTTLGLVPGMWLKIGGTGAGFGFATAACNGWARVSGTPTAIKIPLDNLPAGWGTDDGSGKTIRVFFGDYIKNGTSRTSGTIERGFLGQDTPNYLIQRGMVAGQGEFRIETEQKITGAITFSGLTGQITTTSLDASPDPATTAKTMTANVNVGRVAENGVALSSPNFIRAATFAINNNLTLITDIQSLGAVDIQPGDCTVTGTIDTYFGDGTIAAKLLAGTPSNLNFRMAKNSQAVIWGFPRITFTGGSPSAPGKNQQVMLSPPWKSSKDTLTNAHVIINRLEYFE